MSWPRLTDQQLDALRPLGCPTTQLLAAPSEERRRYQSLLQRGLVEDVKGRGADGVLRITAAGLRALADNIGRIQAMYPSPYSEEGSER